MRVPGAGMNGEALPEGWEVWSAESEGRVILAYRPDVFDAGDFPAPCLPTIYVSDGSRRARPGAGQRRTDEWHVTLFLEPDVAAESATFDGRDEAIEAAVETADRFAGGEIDYRSAYQVPRPDYLDRLDELTARDGSA